VRHPSAIASVVLLCAVGAVAGCGGSSSSSNSSANSQPSTSAAATGGEYGAGTGNNTTTTSGATGSSSGATAVGTAHTSLGTILVAGPKHLTVYLFEADKGTTSNCNGACAQAWPPVTTSGTPHAEGGAQASALGTTKRADGSEQVTYNGHPLYYYVTDQAAGETTGQGITSFGAAWYVLNTQGAKVENS
jgi:predicted lipoprotein with Yx(FWY)xxD motif